MDPLQVASFQARVLHFEINMSYQHMKVFESFCYFSAMQFTWMVWERSYSPLDDVYDKTLVTSDTASNFYPVIGH